MEEKKERLFGSNIFGGQRENKNTAEGLWGVEGDAVTTCPRSREAKRGSLSWAARSPPSRFWPELTAERRKANGGDYHWPVQTQCSKNYTVRLKDARFLKSPNLKIQFEHSRENVFTLWKIEVWMASTQKI